MERMERDAIKFVATQHMVCVVKALLLLHIGGLRPGCTAWKLAGKAKCLVKKIHMEGCEPCCKEDVSGRTGTRMQHALE